MPKVAHYLRYDYVGSVRAVDGQITTRDATHSADSTSSAILE